MNKINIIFFLFFLTSDLLCMEQNLYAQVKLYKKKSKAKKKKQVDFNCQEILQPLSTLEEKLMLLQKIATGVLVQKRSIESTSKILFLRNAQKFYTTKMRTLSQGHKADTIKTDGNNTKILINFSFCSPQSIAVALKYPSLFNVFFKLQSQNTVTKPEKILSENLDIKEKQAFIQEYKAICNRELQEIIAFLAIDVQKELLTKKLCKEVVNFGMFQNLFFPGMTLFKSLRIELKNDSLFSYIHRLAEIPIEEQDEYFKKIKALYVEYQNFQTKAQNTYKSVIKAMKEVINTGEHQKKSLIVTFKRELDPVSLKATENIFADEVDFLAPNIKKDTFYDQDELDKIIKETLDLKEKLAKKSQNSKKNDTHQEHEQHAKYSTSSFSQDNDVITVDDTIKLFKATPNNKLTMVDFTYTKWVNQWFKDPQKALAKQGYKDPKSQKLTDPQDYVKTISIHSFSKKVDDYLEIYGHQVTTPSRIFLGKLDYMVTLPGIMYFHDNQWQTGLFTYIIDSSNHECYHRMFHARTGRQLLENYYQKGFFEVEFPPLGGYEKN